MDPSSYSMKRSRSSSPTKNPKTPPKGAFSVISPTISVHHVRLKEPKEKERISKKPSSLSVQHISGLLRRGNHSLARSILAALPSIDNPSLADQIAQTLVVLHSQSDGLLLECLEDELRSIHDLSLVTREQTPTVFVLKEHLSPFTSSATSLFSGFVELGESLKSKTVRLLTSRLPRVEEGTHETSPPLAASSHHQHHLTCKHSQKLTKKFRKTTMKLLTNIDAIPIELCVLCHRCTLLLEKIPDLRRDQTIPIENWVVTAFLFLRFFIPIVTSSSSSSSSQKRGSSLSKSSSSLSKGVELIGRFLMKLCCRSKFRVSSTEGGGSSSNSGNQTFRQDEKDTDESLINLILSDCFVHFDTFCFMMREKGRQYWRENPGNSEKGSFWSNVCTETLRKDWENEMFTFLQKHHDLILMEAQKKAWDIEPLLKSFQDDLQQLASPVFGQEQLSQPLSSKPVKKIGRSRSSTVDSFAVAKKRISHPMIQVHPAMPGSFSSPPMPDTPTAPDTILSRSAGLPLEMVEIPY